MNPTSLFQFSPGVGISQGITNPTFGMTQSDTQSNSDVIPQSSSNNAPAGSIAGEPFAVWLGMILFLFVLKILTQEGEFKVLGQNVNPAYIRIGGYNWLVVGFSAATFFIIFKLIANRFPLPGITPFANAL